MAELKLPMVSPSGREVRKMWFAALRLPPPGMNSMTMVGFPMGNGNPQIFMQA